ncbi:hypothetical protein BCR43DRAFT_490462 [Syncephalastrum racemosum]|uniref:Kinetochore protein SPC25 n=1 Tax=Syncephalastrum racemosum TaxID=13706 RepID=A0A1X2HG12_SYNRA|nr:hypothetical protein BCR43DRAFT_490462 [Syncephalastrum racemosum]
MDFDKRLEEVRSLLAESTRRVDAQVSQEQDKQNAAQLALHDFIHDQQSQQTALQSAIEQTKLEIAAYEARIPEAEQERQQLTEAIDHMRREIATVRAKRTGTRLERVKQKVAQARGAATENQVRISQRQDVSAQAMACRDALKLDIITMEDDVLKFEFTCVHEDNPSEAYYFILCTPPKPEPYTVRECVPSVPDLPDLLQALNETRDIYQFIRSMWKAFYMFANKKRQVLA